MPTSHCCSVNFTYLSRRDLSSYMKLLRARLSKLLMRAPRQLYTNKPMMLSSWQGRTLEIRMPIRALLLLDYVFVPTSADQGRYVAMLFLG